MPGLKTWANWSVMIFVGDEARSNIGMYLGLTVNIPIVQSGDHPGRPFYFSGDNIGAGVVMITRG